MAGAHALERVAWQHVVLAPDPKRSDLRELGAPPWPLVPRRVDVVRNHAVEPALAFLSAGAAFAGFDVDVEAGAYGDTLDIEQVRTDADVVVFWVDVSRYQDPGAVRELVLHRIQQLRRTVVAPVVIAVTDPANGFEPVDGPGLAFCSVGELVGADGWYRPAMAEAAGTGLSPRAAAVSGRHLGTSVLPALFGRRVKAVMVDLDNTLHQGVLGEEGPDGIVVTPAALALQERLVDASAAGVLVSVVSKNDPGDVAALLADHPDYVLRPHHLFAVEASWSPKADAIARIVQRQRIGLDSVLFVDDNPAELLEVEGALPGVQVLRAELDGDPAFALGAYPGMWQASADDSAALRAADLVANDARDALHAASDDEFFESLGVRLSVRADDPGRLARAAELLVKTNQFNTGLARTPVAEVEAANAAADRSVITVAVRDRLSDSGVVSSILAARADDVLRVDEVCISCRALGRRLETAIVFLSLQQSGLLDDVTTVRFQVVEGPRNQPALDWLRSVPESAWSADGAALDVPAATVRQFQAPASLSVLTEEFS